MTFDESTFHKFLSVVEEFAIDNELDHILSDGDALEWWVDRWLSNGWRDERGRSMNQGCIWSNGTTKRLLPRWCSMLLGYENGYRRKAGEIQ